MNVPGAPADEFYGSSYVKQPPLGQLEVSDDGINYSKVCDLKPIYQACCFSMGSENSFFSGSDRTGTFV